MLIPTVQVRPALMLQDFLRSLNESQESAGMWQGLLLPFLKLTFSRQKMVVSNRNLLFQRSVFRGYVSFREGRAWISQKGDALEGVITCRETYCISLSGHARHFDIMVAQNDKKSYGYQGRNLPRCKNSDGFVPVPL